MERSKIRKALVVSSVTLLSAMLHFIAADLLLPLPKVSKGYSVVIYSKDNEIMHCFLSPDDKWRIRVETDEVSEELKRAILFREDKYFYYHPGINPVAVIRALINNTFKGRRTSGASTITMQLARLMKADDRNLKSKLRESFRALQLEWHYSKDEILQMYINHLPYGGNIEGVRSASMIYFGMQPLNLSAAQVAMLMVIPNNPNSLRPENYENLMQARNHWLQRLGEEGIFSADEITDALAEGFETTRNPLPRLAPHISLRIRADQQKLINQTIALSGDLNHPDRIQSSIDLRLQSEAELLLRNHIRTLRTLQITNGAVLVVDNKTGKMVAYAGSAGFGEDIYSGQVDGVQALRSPGSTLKPALYLYAFDQGYISPKTVITDVPVNFSGYRPENYDETYRGNVTVEQALALSLNVPAVKLMDQVGKENITTLLGNAGFKWIRQNAEKSGLSLILGGCGATLEELTALYTAFANGGRYIPLSYIQVKSNKHELALSGFTNGKQQFQIGTSGSTYLLTEILTGLKRPDLPSEYRESANLPHIAWKTGTSYGRRDAWAIGYNAGYTVGVWIGNFDGSGVPELNGTDCAVPLLFSIFNLLPSSGDTWFKPPADVDFRLVCSETGMVPDTFCHNRTMETYLPGISPAVRCNHLKPVFTNSDKTITYCSECLPSGGYRKSLYPNYAPELISYYESAGIPYTKIPDHNEACGVVESAAGPKITSLTDGAEYLIIAGRSQKLMLRSSNENGTTYVYWYLNKKMNSKSPANQPVYFTAQKGAYTITCVDDRGRSTTINIRVSVI